MASSGTSPGTAGEAAAQSVVKNLSKAFARLAPLPPPSWDRFRVSLVDPIPDPDTPGRLLTTARSSTPSGARSGW